MKKFLAKMRFPAVLFTLLGLLLATVPAQTTRKVSVEALLYDLKHPDRERRKEAAILLGQNRVQVAVASLMAATGDEDVQVRLEALRALIRINDPRAVPAYIRLTQDPEQELQRRAIQGIVKAYVEPEGGFIEGVRKVASFVNPFADDFNPVMVEPFVTVDPQAIEAMVRLLESESSDIRREAAVALGIFRARSALPDILSRLEIESQEGVKVELIRSIYKIGDPAAGPSLIPLTRAPSKKVHDEAIFTLGRLRVREAAPVLRDLYQSGVEERKKIFGLVPVSGSDDLQKNLFQALAFIGDASDQDLFLKALSHENEFYRRYGAEGLARIADPGLIPVTDVARAYLQEKADAARLALSFALYRLGRQEHLVDLTANVKKEQAFQYLLEFEAAEIAQLYPDLKSRKESTQARLLDVLGRRGDSSALPVVEQFTASPSAEVVSAANLALRRLQARIAPSEMTLTN